jgi:hypothetical protein
MIAYVTIGTNDLPRAWGRDWSREGAVAAQLGLHRNRKGWMTL